MFANKVRLLCGRLEPSRVAIWNRQRWELARTSRCLRTLPQTIWCACAALPYCSIRRQCRCVQRTQRVDDALVFAMLALAASFSCLIRRRRLVQDRPGLTIVKSAVGRAHRCIPSTMHTPIVLGLARKAHIAHIRKRLDARW